MQSHSLRPLMTRSDLSRSWTGITAAAQLTGAILFGNSSGCNDSSRMVAVPRLSASSYDIEAITPEKRDLLNVLDSIEIKLDLIEAMRRDAPPAYAMLLIVPAFKERYDQAIAHHHRLMTEVALRKEEVLYGNPDMKESVSWATTQNTNLAIMLGFIEHLKTNSCVPSDWVPPAGFEYARKFD